MFSNKGISVPSGFSLQNNTHDKSLNDSKVTLGKILQCFHINARSIINVSKSCKCQLNKPDIIGITKTWARQEIGNGELSLMDT